MRTLALSLILLGATAAFAQDDHPPPPPPPAPEEIPADVRLYTKASLLMHEQRYASAETLFGQLLRNHPRSGHLANALYWRGHCLEQLGRTQEALRAYSRLVHGHARSGWASDAGKRIAFLNSHKASPGEPYTIYLRKGTPFVGRVQRFGKHALVVTGGPYRKATSVPWSRVRRIKVLDATKPHTLVLRNGDRLSARILAGGPHGLELDLPGTTGPHLVLPHDRLLRVGPDHLLDIEIDDGDRTTELVNPDGSKTITTLHKDGSKTITTIKKVGDGRRVTVIRTKKDGGGDRRDERLELELDGDDLKELKGLPKKLRKKLRGQLKDLDLDLDLEELGDLEDALEDLPEKIRKRIRMRFRTPRKKSKNRTFFFDEDEDEEERRWRPRNKKQRKVWVQKRKKTARKRARDMTKRAIQLRDYTQAWSPEGNLYFAQGGTQDRVYLRNGDKISGELLSVDKDFVRMKTSYGEVKIKRDEVRQITFKRAERPFLGISMSNADGGVKLTKVHENTPASRSGLKDGDVVTAIDGKPVTHPNQLSEIMGKKKVGQTVKLSVTRGDAKHEIAVKLGKRTRYSMGDVPHLENRYLRAPRLRRPARPPKPPKPPRRMKLAPRPKPKARPKRPRMLRVPSTKPQGGSAFLGVSLGADDDQPGVLIDGTFQNSPASRAGLQKGDRLVRIDDTKVTSTSQLIGILRGKKPGEQVTLTLRRGDGVVKVSLPLGTNPGAKKAPDEGSSYAPRARDF